MRTKIKVGVSGVFTILLLWVFSTVSVFAHGDHGDAAPLEGGVSLATVDGFQAELLTSPRPPRAGEESKIVVKILRDKSLAPVRGGKVLIGISPGKTQP